MNNIEAFNILEACNNNTREASEQIVREFQIPETELPFIRSKLIHFKNNRRDFVKRGDITTWERMHFTDNPHPTSMALKKRKSSDSLTESMHQVVFEIDQSLEIRTSLLKLQFKQLRRRLDSVLSHIKSLAELEEVSQKVIASLCLQLIANEEKDYATINVCKEIVEKGTYMEHNSMLCEGTHHSLRFSFHRESKVQRVEKIFKRRQRLPIIV